MATNPATQTPASAGGSSATDQLQTIFHYIGKISNERDLDALLVLLADMGRDLIFADRCTVWLIDAKAGTLWTRVAHGMPRTSIDIQSGMVGYVARTGEGLCINDPYNDSRFDRKIDEQTGYRTSSMIALPIKDSLGAVMGVFQGVNKTCENGAFSEEDQNRLLLASVYTGRELEAAMLQAEIESTQREIIYTLAETGEMRSKETGSHVKRVAEYSNLLAKLCGLPSGEVQILKLASPLHDLGKIAIPDSVLLKPAKLEPEEWAVMQTHTTLGYEMLKHSERPILKAAAIVAAEHHEKWNGEGYPNRKKGSDIHIYGRITALADVFDALGSDRCYKKAWDMSRIVELFKSETGHHFDPDLARAMLEHLDEFIQIRDLYRDTPAEAAQ